MPSVAADEESIHPELALRGAVLAVLSARLAPPVDPDALEVVANDLLKLFEGSNVAVAEWLEPDHAWKDPRDGQLAREWAEKAFQLGQAVASHRLSGVLVLYHGLLKAVHGVIGCDPDCERQFHLPMRPQRR